MGTYYGSNNAEAICSIATDTAGNAIIAGASNSSSNIATTGSYQSTLAADYDGVIATFNKNGSLAWATYYGGSGTDDMEDVAVHVNGDIYVAGSVASSGLATSGAHQTTMGTGGDAILIKLNSSGVRQWATYYPTGVENNNVACDGMGNVYLAGGGPDVNANIATSGAYMTAAPTGVGVQSGYIAKFNSAGTRQWGTYYHEIGDIACDGWGNIVICGKMQATYSGIATTGAHQTSNAGSHDGFVAKLDGSGAYLWGTYYGGNNVDYMENVACDGFGNIYATGETRSTNGIATTGAFQTSIINTLGYNGFLVKFNSAGTRQWGTYYYDNMYVRGVAAGPDGNVYIGGSISSNTSSFTATSGAYQTNHGGGSYDLFLSSFDQNGNRLYSTYYGGPGVDAQGNVIPSRRDGKAVACSPNGKVYLGGYTNSASGIATSGAYQTSYAGISNTTGDCILVQFDADQSVYLAQPYAIDTHYCKGDTIKVSFGATQPFNNGNTFTVQLSDASGSFSSPITLGTVSGTGANGSMSITTTLASTLSNGTGYRVRVIASNPAKTSLDNGRNIAIGTQPNMPVAISNAPLCSGNTLTLSSTTTTTGASYSWTGPNGYTASSMSTNIPNVTTAATGNYIITVDNMGCIRKDTIAVTINQTPENLAANNDGPVCSGTPLNLTASSTTSGATYSWSGPAGYGSTQQNPTISNPQTQSAGTYTVIATLGNCSDTATTMVSILQSPTIGAYVSPGDTICTDGRAVFAGFPANAGTNPQLQWYRNNAPIPGATNSVYTATGILNGEEFFIELKGSTQCNQAVRSQKITMTVVNNPNVTPGVMITSLPGANVRPGTNITFTAYVQNGGPSPKFKWMKNDVVVPNVTTGTWTTNTLLPGDKITVEIESEDPCVTQKTATSAPIYIGFPTSVSDATGSEMLSLYPNPNKGSFTIAGVSGKEVKLEIINAIGQVMYRETARDVQDSYEVHAGLMPGNYLLKLMSEGQSRQMRFTVSE